MNSGFKISSILLLILLGVILLPGRTGVSSELPKGRDQSSKSSHISTNLPVPATVNAGEFINPDGSIKRGRQGGAKISGFSMALTREGEPRFVQSSSCLGWDSRFGLVGGPNSEVFTIAVLGRSLFIGGSFIAVGGVQANRIARYDLDTKTWTSLGRGGGNGVNESVTSLVVVGSSLYVGGFFTEANIGGTQVRVNRVARYDTLTGTWVGVGISGGNGVNDLVFDMALIGTDLYVGGTFTNANEGGTRVPASSLVRLNTITGAWTPVGFAGGNGVDGVVLTLAVLGTDLYIGGRFLAANTGGQLFFASNVVMFRTTTSGWFQLGTSSGNGVDNEVKAFSVINGLLYVGGNFRTAGNGATAVTVNYVAVYNPVNNNWRSIGNGLGNGLNGSVNSLASQGTDLILAGDFTTANVGGALVEAQRVVRFSTTSSNWFTIGSGAEGKKIAGSVYRVFNLGGDVYFGGNFTVVDENGTTIFANNLVAFSTLTGLWGRLAASTGEGANSDVYTMVRVGSKVYVGGRFNSIGGIAANYIAEYDLLTGSWSKLGTGSGNGVNEVVLDIGVVGSDIYVAGAFTSANVGGVVVPVGYVAKYDTLAKAWSQLGSGGGNGLNDSAYSVATIGSDVYFGGSFTTANIGGGSIQVNRLARFETSVGRWSVVGSGSGNGVNEFVFTLAARETDLYVGGIFKLVNEGGTAKNANSIAKFDTLNRTWATLGSSGGNGVDEVVSTIKVMGTDIYVGGIFSNANIGGTKVAAKNIVRYDTLNETWSALGTGGGNGVEDDGVSSMAVLGSDLYVGGYFKSVNTSGPSVPANRVARYRPSTGEWSALTDQGGGNGVDYNVYSMISIDNTLMVGGGFSVVGDGKISSNIGRFCPNNTPLIGPIKQILRQGSTTATIPIATVSDSDQTVDSLAVTAKPVTGGGVNLSAIRVSNEGIVTASVEVTCTAVSSTFIINVVDGFGEKAEATLEVTVGLNTPPVLVYSLPDPIATGGSAVISPVSPLVDNGSVASVAVHNRGTFSGTVTVNSAGEVSVSNATPGGIHTLTIRATDNCGSTTDFAIRLTVNTSPAVVLLPGLTRQAGTSSSRVVIATVSDAETAAGNISVTISNSGAPKGVEFTGLVNNNGTISAIVTATCDANIGGAGFVLQASDGIETTAAGFNVEVSPNTRPVLNYSAVQLSAGADALIRPQSGPSDNGTVRQLTAVGSTGFTGSLSVNPLGEMTIGKAGPVGLHQITIRAVDNCGLVTDTILQLTVNPVTITLTSSSPERLIAGGSAFDLNISGRGFSPGMLARVNGENRPTQVLSSSRLAATILASDIATAGILNVTVTDPYGSVSSPLPINIYDRATITSATSYAVGEVAPDSISVAFAARMADGVRVADSVPLPSSLLGTRVSVQDSQGVVRDQALFFVAPQQVNFLLHPQTALGSAIITVFLNDRIVALGTIEVVRTSPGLFTQNSTGDGVPAAYALRVSDGRTSGVAISAYNQQQSTWLPVPLDLGPPSDQLYLVLFGSGLRGGTGITGITATIGERPVPVQYVGADSFYVGLDQLNLGPLPRSLVGSGVVDLIINVDGKRTNSGKNVRINIK